MMRVWPCLLAILIGCTNAAFAQDDTTSPEATPPANSQDAGTVPTTPTPLLTAPPPSHGPWTLFARVSNGLNSNVNFDQENLGAYGAVLGGGVMFVSDDFEFTYELAGHQYTNTDKWNRVSQRLEATFERRLTRKWEFEAVGQVGFKGTSEDRDLVDQDLEIMPRLQYRFNSDRRIRFFTAHRLKRYNDAPETNARKHYVGVEFREALGERRHWEAGARFETNDEDLARGDYRRWTYWLEQGMQLTSRDMLVMQLRYRLKHYTTRIVEIEDVDHLRLDHRFVPAIGWIHTVNHRFDVRFDYTYESNYSNDPSKEYGAHMAWTSVGARF